MSGNVCLLLMGILADQDMLEEYCILWCFLSLFFFKILMASEEYFGEKHFPIRTKRKKILNLGAKENGQHSTQPGNKMAFIQCWLHLDYWVIIYEPSELSRWARQVLTFTSLLALKRLLNFTEPNFLTYIWEYLSNWAIVQLSCAST